MSASDDKPKNTAAGGPVATAEEVSELRAAQESEYGTYVALQNISFNGAIAYLAGDPVPVSNVKKHDYEATGLVAKVGTKDSDTLISALHEAARPAEVVAQGDPISLGVPVPGTTGK